MIVDDEPLVRRGMAKSLSAESDIELTPEASDGNEALELIREHAPDLVFLDVQMPEMNGFEVLASLEDVERPEVVFVTAYDRYALRAFEIHAVDYLLKPFDEERLQTALSRARARMQQGTDALDDRVRALLEDLDASKSRPDRLMVRSGGRIYFVNVDEVDWFEAADNYVRLHVGDRQHLVRDTIGGLEGRLDPDQFIRVHRSAVINVSRIEEMRPLASGDCDIVLRGGRTVRLSRTYRQGFEARVVGRARSEDRRAKSE